MLSCHPATPCEAIHRFEVRVRRNRRELSLEYSIEGDVAAVCIADAGVSHRADGLWRNTCFEVFLKAHSQLGGYYEFNFSPSTAWAIYRFKAYREGMAIVDDNQPPNIAVSHNAHRLKLDALINLNDLTMRGEGEDLRLALSAVIKERRGRLSYWAYAHAPGKPDFHHPDSFAFQLDQPDRA